MRRSSWVVVGYTAWALVTLLAVAGMELSPELALGALLVPAILCATLLTRNWRWLLLATALAAVTAVVALRPPTSAPLALAFASAALAASLVIGGWQEAARAASAALAERAELLETILHVMPDLVVVKDRAGHIVLADPQSMAAPGFALEEIGGRPESDFAADPELVLSNHATDRHLLSTGEPLTFRGQHGLDEAGRVRWYQSTKTALTVDGHTDYVLVVATDITERVLAEQQLVDQNNLLQTLINGLPDLICVKDRDGRYVVANAAYVRLLGAQSMDEVSGKTDLDFFSAATTADYFADEQRVMRIGEPLLDKVETIHIESPGQQRWVLTSKIPLFGDQGQVTHLIGISRDITALKQSEDALRAAKDEAEAAARAKSEFLANTSHEIRTPLNAVIGMTDLLLDTELTADQTEYVNTIRVSGENLLAILNDFLDFSKIESGNMNLERQPYSVLECIEETLDMFSPGAFQKGIKLAYTVDDALLSTVIGDSLRLRQVLINLIGNAVKFTEQGEVVVAAAGEIMADGRYRLNFAVRDTGVGIPEHQHRHLFRSFSQVDNSMTRRYGGAGLGLAISKRLVEMMDGEISVDSYPGAGSVFNFQILVEPADTGQWRPPELQSLHAQRLLLVDDNQTNLKILIHQFKRWGLDVSAVASSVEALRILSQGERFDVAIFDMLMPELDGIQLATRVRKTLAGAELPIILLTSVSDVDTRAAAREQGFASVLTKPAKLAQLYEAVSSAVGYTTHHYRRLRGTQQLQTEFATRAAARRPLHILLAEDNPINQKVATRLLARLGHTSISVENGLEAVMAVQANDFDVILMDIHMPEMDGLDATRLIRKSLPPARQPYIIALTADVMEGFQKRCLDAGMDAYISKPVRIDELAIKLHKVETANAR